MRLAAAARFVAHLESLQRGRPRNDGDGTVGVTQQVLDPKKLLQGSPQPQNEHQVVNSEDHRGQTDPWANSHILSSTKNLSWEQGVLRNDENKKRVPEEEQQNQLCDPTTDGSDVGLLSCGFNYYCAESHDSYLGGVCTELLDKIHHRHLDDVTDASTENDSTTFVSYCSIEDPTDIDCDCTGFDPLSGNGDINCRYAETYCFQECPLFCANITLSSTVRDTFKFAFCLESGHISSLMNFNRFCEAYIQHNRNDYLLLQYHW